MTTSTPLSLDDPTTKAILKVSEDGLAGFCETPFAEIARRSGVAESQVLVRINELLEAGVIRRIRMTLNTSNLAHGALIAWKVPGERLQAAFAALWEDDPFSGHVVIRSTDSALPGSGFRLWTTLKVPQGFLLQRHVETMAREIGAEAFRIMPAKCLFALGVGHVRRRQILPGARVSVDVQPRFPTLVRLSPEEWHTLAIVKEPLEKHEIVSRPWKERAERAGVSEENFVRRVETLGRKGLLGRFSTFLEHVRPLSTGEQVTRYNALFHWKVALGQELQAGMEVGRHEIITHAYWREGGPEFGDVNLMAVAHGVVKEALLEHKASIDSHLHEAGIQVGYTTQFWGGRSEIKPSEILPTAYESWCIARGLDPDSMRGDHDEIS